MSVGSEIKTLLFHPASFFAKRQEEGVKRSLLLFSIVSIGVVLGYALSTIVFSFMNPRMTPAIFMDLFPEFGQILVIFFLRYIGLILVLIVFSYLVIRFFRSSASIQKIVLIFCYAQTPLAFFITGLFVLTIVGSFITRLFNPFFVILFSLPFFPLIGFVWMTFIAIKGFQEYQILSGMNQYLGIASLILIVGFGFLFTMGFFVFLGLSPDTLISDTKPLNQSETVFSTPDQNRSQYRNGEMGIEFLFPADWKVNTTRTAGYSQVSYSITSSNQREEKRSSVGEKVMLSQSLSERPHHFFWPLKVTGSPAGSRSHEQSVASDIAQQTLIGYDLLNQSPIRIDNRTGTFVHMQMISEQNKVVFWGNQPITMKGEPEISQYEDSVWVDANGMRYSFHLTSYAAGYDQYRWEFSHLLDSVRFTEVSPMI